MNKLLTFAVIGAALLQGCNMNSPVTPLSTESVEGVKSARVVCGGYDVSGAFLTTYNAHSDDLGCSRSAKTATPNGLGEYQRFERGNIMKKNSSSTAYEVHGLIFNKYGVLGWENGVLKFPRTNENDCPYKKGRYNAFEGGRILWQNGAAEAYALYGNIDVMYGRVSSEFGPLGYPASDVKVAASSIIDSTYFSNFQNGKIKYRIKRNWKGVTYKETWVVMESSIYSVDPLVKTKITSFSMPKSTWGNGKLIAVKGSGFKAGAQFSVYVDQPTNGPKYLDGGFVKSDGTIDYKTDPMQTIECVFLSTFEVPSNRMSTIRVVDNYGNTALATYSFLKCSW